MALCLSTAYHSETDGQTESANKCNTFDRLFLTSKMTAVFSVIASHLTIGTDPIRFDEMA